MSTSRGTWRRACRCPRSKDPKGVALFGRVVGAPSDRNLIDFYADGGITFSGMIPRRPDDSLAIGVAYTGISDRVRSFDVDSAVSVARNYEALLEICYTTQLAFWLDAAARFPVLLAARRQYAE